jgi:hypothetical protein
VSTEQGAPIQQWACHDPQTEANMRNQSWTVTST